MLETGKPLLARSPVRAGPSGAARRQNDLRYACCAFHSYRNSFRDLNCLNSQTTSFGTRTDRAPLSLCRVLVAANCVNAASRTPSRASASLSPAWPAPSSAAEAASRTTGRTAMGPWRGPFGAVTAEESCSRLYLDVRGVAHSSPSAAPVRAASARPQKALVFNSSATAEERKKVRELLVIWTFFRKK